LMVNKKRIKTSRQLGIPLLKAAQIIYEKYLDHPCRRKNRVLPVLSNQKMNAYLKEIADLCGINQRLSTHLARHTFATTVALAHHVPIEVTSAILGHSTIQMTQVYARMQTKRLKEEMKKLDKVLDGEKADRPVELSEMPCFCLN
jgi:site-specific recombinase XerD